jgi:hypothetical protein
MPKNALYQGTTSVVPQTAAENEGFSPCGAICVSARLRPASAAQPASRTLLVQHINSPGRTVSPFPREQSAGKPHQKAYLITWSVPSLKGFLQGCKVEFIT